MFIHCLSELVFAFTDSTVVDGALLVVRKESVASSRLSW